MTGMTGLTRFAPTPSGYLHEGNAANFLLTSRLAQIAGLRIRLRIDDLDRSRFRPGYLNDIFEVLQWLGLNWHLGPTDSEDFLRNYSQLQRMGVYHDMLDGLRARGAVYACGCTRSRRGGNRSFCAAGCAGQRYSLDDPDKVWVCPVDPTFKAALLDWQGNVALKKLTESGIVEFVVRRRREPSGRVGYPSYQLACVADDVLDTTTHIVRGADLLESSLMQLWIAHCLDLGQFSSIRFVHHPLLTGVDGQKLSKSAGDRLNSDGSGSLRNRWASALELASALPLEEWLLATGGR